MSTMNIIIILAVSWFICGITSTIFAYLYDAKRGVKFDKKDWKYIIIFSISGYVTLLSVIACWVTIHKDKNNKF